MPSVQLARGPLALGASANAAMWPMLRRSLLRRAARFRSTAASAAEGNPILEAHTARVPQFARVEPRHVVPAITELVGSFEARLTEVEAQVTRGDNVTFDGVVTALEKAKDGLEVGWGMVGHLNGVRNSAELRGAYQEAQPLVVKAMMRYGQSAPLYTAYTSILHSGGASLSEAQRRVLERAILEAQHGGVGLEGAARDRFGDIQLRLSALSTEFANNVLDATKAWTLLAKDPAVVEGLPESVRGMMSAAARSAGHSDDASAERGPWLLTLDQPCFGPFMQYGAHRATRAALHRAYLTRASELEDNAAGRNNSGVMLETLALRSEKAALLGYDSYAALSVAVKMAKTVPSVHRLLDDLLAASRAAADAELAQLRAYAAKRGHEGPLLNHDVAYWSERQKTELFGVNDEQLRPYFPLPAVLKGLFGLAESLFGVRIEEESMPEGVQWNGDVAMYRVTDAASRKQIASFFLDPYSRPHEKRGGAWMDVCVGRSAALAPPGMAVRLPIAHLVCNQTPPVDGKPSLMTFREVETLFHEFGHGLQHMLTTVNYGDAAGINGIEWDAVELPSQFMENWCYDYDTVRTISRHYETGEPLPDALFHKLAVLRKYMAGTAMLRQLLFAQVDMDLHGKYHDGFDAQAVYRSVAQTHAVLPPADYDRFLCSFSHIFAGGYAAGYYSYKWAEVLAQDAYSAFAAVPKAEQPGVGARFRSTVLAMGGARAPELVFEDFRGRPPSPQPLLETYGLAAQAAAA